MNFSTLLLTLFLTSMPLQTSAGLSSWFSLSAWIQTAKRNYHWLMHKEKMFEAITKLEKLRQIDQETENLRKIFWVVEKSVSPEKLKDNEFIEALRRDQYKLEKLFLDKQQNEWQLHESIQPLVCIDIFKQHIVEPALENSEKENYVSSNVIPKSWHEQLKEKERNLPEKELKKTAQERAEEFRRWQKSDPRSFQNK